MLGTLTEFVEELRAVGIPVSLVEAGDAAEGLMAVDVADRESVRHALRATLIKNESHLAGFDTAFEVYFGLSAAESSDGDVDLDVEARVSDAPGGGSQDGDGGDALAEAILAALLGSDSGDLRSLIQQAVVRLAGMEPGRPVGGRYYFHRVSRRLDIASLRDRLAEALTGHPDSGDDPEREADDRIEELTTELRREIIRRLVADRGRAAVAKTLRVPLVEDIELMHATREELVAIERAVAPLARKLASRISHRRRHQRRGRLDVRSTVRRSLAHGGALIDPRFKARRISKPDIVLLCDISGSMATFARFTMQLVYAISNQLARVRAFAFIDGLDEVTGFFGPGVDFHDALVRMGREADVVHRDGHSDYGNALTTFWEGHGSAITAKTTVIVTGDARNNYRDNAADVVAEIADTARHLYWLNPEPSRYWDTGDSVMSAYAPHCDTVEQVRTLKALERFVEGVL
ncbi:MAG: VWA domain-containing protein [Acidimicrobiia bacterium]|nr:VWA domain-containing protein [Acidimicrobiia bacterium]